MKAIICNAYGPPEVLSIQERPTPVPKDDEVLIQIKAFAVNSGDVRVRGLVVNGFLRIVMRFVLGFNKPRNPILGTTLCGIVTQCGKNVTKYKVGDEVFASTEFKFGTYAEYTVAKEKSSIALKPRNASFEEAAAITFGGMTSLYFLGKAGISAGKKVMIYGASGSVGCAALEISKYYQATVTAVCGEKGFDLCKKAGSDKILNYETDWKAEIGDSFDIIFDAVGKIKEQDVKHLLAKGGKFCTVGGLDVAKESQSQMETLKTMFENGGIHANIERIYSFDEIVEAHRYVDTGRKKGNIVVKTP